MEQRKARFVRHPRFVHDERDSSFSLVGEGEGRGGEWVMPVAWLEYVHTYRE